MGQENDIVLNLQVRYSVGSAKFFCSQDSVQKRPEASAVVYPGRSPERCETPIELSEPFAGRRSACPLLSLERGNYGGQARRYRDVAELVTSMRKTRRCDTDIQVGRYLHA